MGSEKRKHTRVAHQGAVEFVTGTRRVHGTSINISRTGMQVVVNLPESHETIRNITFQLPGGGQQLEIPCRLVRSTRSRGDEEQTLGIEFQHDTETQLLLIQKFVQEEARRSAEARQLPRTDCRLERVRIDRPGVKVLSVDNISAEGLLLSFTGRLEPEEVVGLVLHLPEDDRPLTLRGGVVYVVESAFQGVWTAGVRLLPLKEAEANRLRNFILATSSGSVIQSLYGHFKEKTAEPEFRLLDPEEISRLLDSLRSSGTIANILFDGSFTIWERCITRLDAERAEFELSAGSGPDALPAQAGNAYFTFFWNDSSHYFKTECLPAAGKDPRFRLPEVIFRSDKRSYRRKNLERGTPVTLVAAGADGREREFLGTLIDISRRGFLCSVAVPRDEQQLFRQGDTLRYRLQETLALDNYGQIRHVHAVEAGEDGKLHIGIEAGIARRAPRRRHIPIEEWLQNPETELPDHSGQPLESIVVHYQNEEHQELCGLINATRLSMPAPVVVIPSAYGKKKEALAPLAATLLDNFRARKQDLVVLRYDGINRPGESHQDVRNPRRGYEMLSYRASQGLEDLRATLRFVRRNPYFQAERVILITFSMSSIDARRLLSSPQEPAVDLWISCMGVPAAQATLRNSLGGIDVISNYRMGIPNGIMGLLGHLINMDIMAEDMVGKRYAYLTDARSDMSRISVPVLWICGQHDRWVESAEVEDVMSVRAPGRRELVMIPAGHNLRTSTDAIRTFRLITRHVYRQLHAKSLPAGAPRQEALLRQLAAERERLTGRAPVPLLEYWHDYLLGNERNNTGYDFYQNIEEFKSFLAKEVELLEVQDGDVIADLGCGTGLFLETLLQTASSNGGSPALDITAVDLIEDALARSRAKCDQLLAKETRLRNVRLRYLCADLEPNRLIPVSLFMRNAGLSFEFLRNKVEGLANATIDRLLASGPPQVYALLRGEEPSEALLSALRDSVPIEDVQAVLDFNLAARFLRGSLTECDLLLRPSDASAASGSLRTSDLELKVLRFGDCSACLDSQLPEREYSKIVASLFISYLFNPEYLLADCFRLLRPGGVMLVSTMRPDSDISTIFTNYIRSLKDSPCTGENRLSGALAMLNEAASLFELEEDGLFRFYSSQELHDLLEQAGFTDIAIFPSFGRPPQALIAIAKKS